MLHYLIWQEPTKLLCMFLFMVICYIKQAVVWMKKPNSIREKEKAQKEYNLFDKPDAFFLTTFHRV